MNWNEKLEWLKGKTLISIYINDGKDSVSLKTEEGIISFVCYGDCCSTSWIEHCDSPSQPSKIIEMKEIEIPPSFDYPKTKTHFEEDSMQYYFYEILTDKGSFLIEMRNSSNGYYGGYLE